MEWALGMCGILGGPFYLCFLKRKVALHRFFSFLGICGHLSPVEDGQVPEFRGLSNHILPNG
jgi:hypothetical protein